MYIHQINIAKFRHIENVVIGPLPFNSKSSETFVFAGPNGGGKSSIMELIGYALSNSYSLGWSLSRTFEGFSFEVAIGLNGYEINELILNLNEELKQAENQRIEQLQNITENLSLNVHQRTMQTQRVTDQSKSTIDSLKKIVKYFDNNNIYFRSYLYSGGEYEKDTFLYNQIHERVTATLRNKLKRPLGFFLKADRSYPQKGFQQNKIFSFSSTLKYEHLNTIAFNTSEIQYQDMYDFLVQQRYHYLRNLGSYQHGIDNGQSITNKPEDPLKEYEKLLQNLFPDYSFVEKNEDVPTNLFISLPSGDVITFNDLSSGEKEVFFILSFFIRHNVENAIIMIDEPELHLHPELARLLIKNMQKIKSGNQIWLATHNSEIIDEAGRDRVTYISKDPITKKAKIIYGNDEENAVHALKSLFGFSGYIGVAKNLIFLEGDNSSADRRFFTNIIPTTTNLKFIPSNGSGNMHSINAAILSILDSNLGWMNFYLVRDRDYLTAEMIEKYRQHKSGRLFVLERHEIENYLLVPIAISNVLENIFNIKMTSTEVKQLLLKCALSISASVLRDMISFRTNLLLQPEDFSMGKFLNNEAAFDEEYKPKDEVHDLLSEKFFNISEGISKKVTELFSNDNLQQIINSATHEVQSSLQTDNWLSLFPGKELLEKLCKELKITQPIVLQNSLIKELGANQDLIPSDLITILNGIN